MHDILIIGAGHNGLTCAHYLAKRALKVAILEASDKVGGAAVTDEFHPGFKNSAASYIVSLLQPKVIRTWSWSVARAEGRAAQDGQFPARPMAITYCPAATADPDEIARMRGRWRRLTTATMKSWRRSSRLSRNGF